MMSREALVALLIDTRRATRTRKTSTASARCWRTGKTRSSEPAEPGHITSSAWIVSRESGAAPSLTTGSSSAGSSSGARRWRDRRSRLALREAEESPALGIRRAAAHRWPRNPRRDARDPGSQGRARPRAPRHPLPARGLRRSADRRRARVERDPLVHAGRGHRPLRRGEHPAHGQKGGRLGQRLPVGPS